MKITIKVFMVLGGVMILIIVAAFFTNRKIENQIASEFQDMLTYEKLNVNLLGNKMAFEKPGISLDKARIKAVGIDLEGLSYLEYLRTGKIVLDKIVIEEPEFIIFKNAPDSEETAEKFEKDILIRSIRIRNGVFRIVENDSVDQVHFVFSDLELETASLDSATVEHKVPLDYEEYHLVGDSLYLELDDQHHLSGGKMEMLGGKVHIEDLRITPKYDKVEFQRRVPHEKDRFDLVVGAVELDSLDWGFENDSLFMSASRLGISDADLEVYRNKLIRDDPGKKTLYSEKLRNAPVKLDIQKVEIQSSKIEYQEKIKAEMEPAVVFFTNLNATVYRLSNKGMAEQAYRATQVDARANFMGEPNLEVDWEFDARSLEESFAISGSFGPLSGPAINLFLRPALNIETRGGIESLAFNFSGNDDRATGEMQLKYEEFKVDVLREEGTEKSGFLSGIVNFFINNDAITEDYNHEDLQVTRDKTKSFWNFLWLCLREGALSSFL